LPKAAHDWLCLAQTSTQNGRCTTLIVRNIVKKVHKAKLRHLDDGNAPQEPASSKVEEADTRAFAAEIL
jgi:hypothetical protein